MDIKAAATNTARRVLVVEDDPDIGRLVTLQLAELGCESRLIDDGVAALAEAQEGRYDLVILDIMLPRMDGLQICRRLRGAERYTPILMLTAKSSEIDRVLGLELGADDYLTKPFSLAELLARVKALLRRAALLRAAQADSGAASKVIRNGALEILPAKRQVRWRDSELELTALEFDLLLHFASHPGLVFSRAQLLDAVWGYSHDGYEHTVTTHINRLRSKLEADPMRPELILTVRGAGYKFREPPR